MQLPSDIERLYITLCPNHFISFPLKKFPCFLSSVDFFSKSTLNNISGIPSEYQNRKDLDQA